MKSIRFIIPAIAILLLLASCSSERNFSKRKYLPGLFRDQTGKKEIVAAENKLPENAFQADSSADKPSLKEEESKTIPTEYKSSDSLPLQQKQIVPNEKRLAENNPLLLPPNENAGTDEPVKEIDEQKRINLALIFALIAVGLFVAAVIATAMGTIGLFLSLGLLVALGCAITGMVLARKVRLMHVKGESYEGKMKVIFARIIGIAGIVLTSAFLALLAFAIAAFAIGW